ncbi:hypothetical protein SAMD00020551_1188 [Mesobacillus selenatarsenatis SF-1]|uniref:Uncharacterized protein n=1 Tax=Mesobacillus selenatarsenatis (strain DSM 18680 / JCM 14380 / FERM P-15431 / SF-1) TaxID=1321606 RepID=A0A0A8X1Z0_MESS1|nr:hypothetical protein SAMD00020551_1188 [Mesobacillus selenatarsenatis SF-1]
MQNRLLKGMINLENERLSRFDQIVEMGKEGQKALNEYWWDFSLYTSFEYWLMVLFLVAPLILLLLKINKNKLFQILFYGYSIHMPFGYIDLYGRNMGYWNYPFPVIPVLPGISLDSSLIPIIFIFVYQSSMTSNKKYYLYATITSVILSFVFKPMLVGLGLFKMYGSINYFHLFISYVSVFIFAKVITDFFLWNKKRYRSNE